MKSDLIISPQYEEQAYVLSSNTEDVEMKDVEDEEDEEDAVAEELGTQSIISISNRHLMPS